MLLIILLFIVIIGLLAGGIYLTNINFDIEMKAFIEQKNKEVAPYGIVLEYRNLHDIFIQKDTVSLVQLTQEYFDYNEIPIEVEQPITFHINQTCQIWPLYTSCENTLKPPDDHPFNFDRQFWSQINYSWSWQYTVVSSRITSYFSIDSFELDEWSQTNIGNISGYFESDKDFLYNTLTLNVEEIESKGIEGDQFHMDDLEVTLFFDREPKKKWKNEAKFKIHNVKFKEAQTTILNADNLMFHYHVTEPSNNNMEMHYKWHIDDFYFIGEPPLILSKLNVDIDIKGINSAATMFYEQFSEYIDEVNPQEQTKLLDKLSESPVALHINQLDTYYNDVLFDIKGIVYLPIVLSDHSQLDQNYINHIKGDLNIIFGKNIGEIHPVMRSLIPIYQEKGIIKETNNNYSMAVHLKEGKITSNNTIIGAL